MQSLNARRVHELCELTAVGFFSGSRVAAPLSSAGMVVLAYEPPGKIEDILSCYQPKAFSPHTMVDKQRILLGLDQLRRPGYDRS